LDEIGENIHREDIAERANNFIDASKYGLIVWENLIKLMKRLQAKSIFELQEGHTTIYDLLYWATSFADELHNASRIDKSFQTHKLQILSRAVDEAPEENDVEELFQTAFQAKNQWADMLIVTGNSPADDVFKKQGEQRGLLTNTVNPSDLEPIVGPLKESFASDFMGKTP